MTSTPYLVNKLFNLSLETPPLEFDRNQFVTAHDRVTALFPPDFF